VQEFTRQELRTSIETRACLVATVRSVLLLVEAELLQGVHGLWIFEFSGFSQI
jgi:hypothetical protein